MFTNYLTTAWRNIIRRKAFSFIMISGLAVGMAVCLLVIVIINDQLSFDTFHPNADRIFRINTYVTHSDNTIEKTATAPFLLGDFLKNNYSPVEKVVRVVRNLNTEVWLGQNKLALHGIFTDPSFLDVFGFTLQAGDPSIALTKPNSLILSHETAIKFFGNKNPIGEALSLQKFGDFTVTGVFNETNKHSQVQFDAIASVASMRTLEIGSMEGDLQNYYSSYLYVLLQQGKSIEYLNSILDESALTINAKIQTTHDKSISLHAEHITGVSQMAIGSAAIPSNVLWVLSLLGFIVILSASFNYTNLSIASSLSRSKEIGIRKTMGASRVKIFSQFILQSVIISLVSLVIAIIPLRFLGASFSRMVPQLSLSLQVSAYVYLLFLLFSIFIGIIAGLFPAAYLSAFKAISAIKGDYQTKIFAKLPLRKAVLLVQFLICFIAVISITIIYRQMDYITNTDYGFDKANIINVDLQGVPYENVMHDLRNYSHIVGVSASSGLPGTEKIDQVKIRTASQLTSSSFHEYSVDENFISNLNIRLVAGKNFPADVLHTREKFVLLNEKAVQALSFGSSSEAVGKDLTLNDTSLVQVVGVVKDFNFLPLTNSLSPLILRANQSDLKYLNIKFMPAQKATVIAFLTNKWRSFDNVNRLRFSYYDDDIDSVYQPYKSIFSTLSFVGLLAIVITCMGLLGIVIFTIQMRQKEIGIRRVLGSSVSGIVLLISKGFLKLLVVASVVAIPLSLFVGHAFLNEFAYKVNIGAGTILIGISLIYLLVVGVVCSQVIRVAIANPTESLRVE